MILPLSKYFEIVVYEPVSREARETWLYDYTFSIVVDQQLPHKIIIGHHERDFVQDAFTRIQNAR